MYNKTDAGIHFWYCFANRTRRKTAAPATTATAAATRSTVCVVPLSLSVAADERDGTAPGTRRNTVIVLLREFIGAQCGTALCRGECVRFSAADMCKPVGCGKTVQRINAGDTVFYKPFIGIRQQSPSADSASTTCAVLSAVSVPRLANAPLSRCSSASAFNVRSTNSEHDSR